MSGITYLIGNATTPEDTGNKIIAHICNDVGRWGKGFVIAISVRWKNPENEYRRWYKERTENNFGLGQMQLVKVEPELWVANMVGQTGIKTIKNVPPIRYDAVEKCLKTLTHHAIQLQASVHLPRIGCGLAGGRWEEIEPLIEKTLCESGIAVTVYDFG